MSTEKTPSKEIRTGIQCTLCGFNCIIDPSKGQKFCDGFCYKGHWFNPEDNTRKVYKEGLTWKVIE